MGVTTGTTTGTSCVGIILGRRVSGIVIIVPSGRLAGITVSPRGVWIIMEGIDDGSLLKT
jgi:hypothetical protein